MTTKCTNMFLEEDGYCNRCSSYHFKTDVSGNVVNTTPRRTKREKLAAEKSAKIEQNILDTPELRVARETVELLSEIYELPVEVVFRNRNGSYHTTDWKTGGHKIVFSYSNCKHYWKHGYTEYKSLQWMLGGKELTGTAGIQHLAMHEFAHALQTEIPGGRTYGSVHNSTFIKCYQEVMELVN